ncbi:MAG: isochorismatase family protein [Alphaproteobacteria bacterium]|nr:isochorismatase family protein [Alphaproteobacteria bacterium]
MLITAETTSLIIVDVQERLAPVMAEPRRAIYGCEALVRAATRIGVPLVISEHCPEGQGPTMIDLRTAAPEGARLPKTRFSCAAEPVILERLEGFGRNGFVVAGVETHVAVLQTALGLRQRGYRVFVVTDACSARQPVNEPVAHARLATAGVHLVTVEMVLFEWLGGRNHPAYTDVLKLVQSP